jgi:hypothetical protein
MQDVELYFLKNISNVKPNKSYIYLDEIFSEFQTSILKKIVLADVEFRTGNWRDKNMCIVQIVSDMKDENRDLLIIDSDTLLDEGFAELDEKLQANGYDYYTILEHSRKTMYIDPRRVRKVSKIDLPGRSLDVNSYKIAGFSHGIFYLGPKQGIRIGKLTLSKLDSGLIEKLSAALSSMHRGIGNQLSDETTLGILFYYSGIKETPWVEYSTHMQHSAGTDSGQNYSRILKSIVNYKLARGLFSSKRPRIYWYYLRYKLTGIFWSIFGD